MVNISPGRMRSVSEARNGFNSLIAEVEDGLTTHVLKGSTVVAHIVPPNTPVLDDPQLRLALIYALTEQEAAAVGKHEWRDDRLQHAGDPVGRLFAWTWKTDPDLFMRAFAHFHSVLQSEVGQYIGLGALWPGVSVALAVGLDSGEIAAAFRHLDRNYDDYDVSDYDNFEEGDAEAPEASR